MTAHDHEIVSIYGFSDDEIDKLMENCSECVLMWATQDGWPVGVIHAYVWQDKRVWLTFSSHRHRTAAIKRDPRVSITVSSSAATAKDSPLGSATMKGRAIFHDDDDTKEWFYRALSRKVSPNSQEGEDHFHSILDSPLRVILEIIPEKWITFDAKKSAKDMAGKLSEDEKTPRKSSDAVRMNKERTKRGLEPR
jgi:nitroimidazol reductase NimA-like FMN-containing flavoprotein (pyridoxamine 5'-phosphate oxidase superfamily)